MGRHLELGRDALTKQVTTCARSPTHSSHWTGFAHICNDCARSLKRRPPRMQQTVSEHLAICAAIHDGDETAAAQATALHISNSLHNILAVMTDDVIGRTTFATPTTADGHEQETRRDTR